MSFSESPCSLAHRLWFLPDFDLFWNLLYYLFCFWNLSFPFDLVEGIGDDHGAVCLEIQRVDFGIAGISFMYLTVLV